MGIENLNEVFFMIWVVGIGLLALLGMAFAIADAVRGSGDE